MAGGGRKWKFVVAVLLPLLTVGSVAIERLGFWDWCFGVNDVLRVAERFEQSYAPDASRPLRPDEPGWKPMLHLISWYSPAKLPANREPQVLARMVAVASSKLELGRGQIAEWTAPSTPFALIYVPWPGNADVPPADYRIVGAIGDIRHWVERLRSAIHFVIQDILLGLTAAGLGFTIWWYEHRRGDGDAPVASRRPRARHG